jgi:hypothetical protein
MPNIFGQMKRLVYQLFPHARPDCAGCLRLGPIVVGPKDVALCTAAQRKDSQPIFWNRTSSRAFAAIGQKEFSGKGSNKRSEKRLWCHPKGGAFGSPNRRFYVACQ